MDAHVGVSETMEQLILEQARAKNRRKPLALFLNWDALLKEQDPDFFENEPEEAIQEKKRMSLIESFWWFNHKCQTAPTVSEAKLVTFTTAVLCESRLPLPEGCDETDHDELKQEVRDMVDWLDQQRAVPDWIKRKQN